MNETIKEEFSVNKTVKLKDGAEIVIRSLSHDDLDKLMDFYRALPEDDRKYLRVDVTDRAVVSQRIKLMDSGGIFRVVALHGEEIIADGALELSTEEWVKHQAELRVIVARKYQLRGLGMIMMRELHLLAAQKKVERMVVKMMRPQLGARKICRKLGFHDETVLPDYVKDTKGETQDLIIMICDMNDFWKDLEDMYVDSDWQRHR